METGRSFPGDRISDMPQNIIENILSRLNLGEAVKTCILPKTWRYKWVTLPKLRFDPSIRPDLITLDPKLALPQLIFNPSIRHDLMTPVRFIDGILSLHQGPICEFQVIHMWIPNTPEMLERWILCLSRNYIQKLVLRLYPQPLPYELPLSLYSCEHLTHLKLTSCALKSPPTVFSCFNSLRSFSVFRVICVGFTYGDLVSRCPVLERFIIEDGFTDYTDLVIQAPMLQELVVSGYCRVRQSICIQNTPLLTSLSFDLECLDFEGALMNREVGDENIYLQKIFGSLVGLETLSVCENFLKFFSVASIPRRLQITFDRLKKLKMEVCFNDWDMISMGLCLIRSAPNLQELLVDAYRNQDIELQVLEIEDQLERPLNHLKNVTITSFCGLKTQTEFIRFLLATAPALEKMTVGGYKDLENEEGEHIDESVIMKFPRVSSKAAIEYYEM